MAKIESVVRGKGWFVYLLSGLYSASPEFIDEYSQNSGYGYGLESLRNDLSTLAETGVALKSRRSGWYCLEHPALGQIRFKMGYNFRNGKPYLFVEVCGRKIVHSFPKVGLTSPEDLWPHPTASAFNRQLISILLSSA